VNTIPFPIRSATASWFSARSLKKAITPMMSARLLFRISSQ
jgi:hypothetical protein